jgi:hypothetical protein
MKCLGFMVLALVAGCHAASNQPDGPTLTESQALTLAVELANEKCEARYSFAPFNMSSYLIEFKDGRWHWGSLDPAGESGFSAVVSFGPRGEDHHVEIFLSIDTILPRRDDDDERE